MRIHKNLYVAVLFLVVSFICMLFLTTASPLYSVNPSLDGNTMFTVGKSLWHGLMPYKDLFDQRGPLIYFMNSVAALISYKSFFGIYIFESIAMFLDLFFIFKILNLKFKRNISILNSFSVIPFVFTSKFLTYGNLPEEYILPLIFITIYMLTNKSVSDWDKHEYIIIGFFISISFWIKYTLSVTWLSVYLVLIIYYVYKKNWKKLLSSIEYGAIGFAPISLFIIIVYAFKQALYKLFYVYFYLNITVYDQHSILQILNYMIIMLVVIILFLLVYELIYELPMISRNMLFIMVMSNYLVLLKVSWLNYYIEIISFVFLIVPLVICKILTDYRIIRKLIFIIPIVSFVGIFITNKNIFHYYNYNVAQEKFSKIIDKSPKQNLLNYGTLDNGFYTYSGVVPQSKYFDVNNMSYQKMYDKQNSYIESMKYKFVVIRYSDFPKSTEYTALPNAVIKKLATRYKIVGKSKVVVEGKNEKYVLYERKY